MRVGRAAAAIPARLLGFLVAVAALFVPLRSGEQVFAAVDPDFRHDAWGGPSYLGACLAHWLDGVLMLYAATLLLRWLADRNSGQAPLRT